MYLSIIVTIIVLFSHKSVPTDACGYFVQVLCSDCLFILLSPVFIALRCINFLSRNG